MKRLLKIVCVLICVSVSGFECARAQDSTTAASSPAVSEASPSLPSTVAPDSATAVKDAAGVNTSRQPAQPADITPANEQLPPSKLSKETDAANEGKGGKGDQNQATQPGKTAGTGPAGAPYVIGSLDVLVIKVWNNSNLSGPYDVRSDGMLSMPLIGEIRADGLTARQLKELLTARLEDFLHNPEVDVQVAKVNSKRYFVYGEVLHAGEFPLIEATTVMDALANVGGFKDFANPKKIYIMRGAQKFNFNYKDVSKGKNLEQNILLQNGDRIYVP